MSASTKAKRDDRSFIVPIGSIRPWARNPRRNDEAVAAVATSIEQFDFNAPIIVCKATGEIVAGHVRYKAAVQLGLTEVPIRYTDITPERAYAYAIADNRIGEIARWDDVELGKLLSEIPAQGDANLTKVLGFETQELQRRIRVSEYTRAAHDADDEVPEPPKVSVTSLGDIWQLGRHKLLCGSCEQLGSIAEKEFCKLLVTDPPYGVNYAAKNRALTKWDRRERIGNDIVDDEQFDPLKFCAWFKAIRVLLPAGACFYITFPSGPLFFRAEPILRECGFPTRQLLIWAKNQMVLGRFDYNQKHEPILYGWIEGAAHHAVANRGETTLWEIDRPRAAKLHPTMKPVELYARAMRNSSDPGDAVLEPFAGSGTAFMAAEQEGRICIGSELVPAYCDVIVERWQQYAGKKAVRVR